MSQHTSGTWKNFGRHIYEVGSDRPIGSAVSLAATNLKKQKEEDDVAVANARVMAAAPDLLAALEYAREEIAMRVKEDGGTAYSVEKACRIIDSAIAKAKNCVW